MAPDRFDMRGQCRIVPQQAAQFAHALLGSRVAAVTLAPDKIAQVLLADDLALPLDQGDQHVQRLGAQLVGLVPHMEESGR